MLQVLTTCRVVFEDGFVQVQSYRVAYAVFGSLAVTSSLVSIVYRIRHARHVRTQIRNVASSAALSEDDMKGSLLSKLRWEQAKVSRDLRAKAVTLLGLVLEDVPMVRARCCAITMRFRASRRASSQVTLSCLLVLREGNTDRMVRSSALLRRFYDDTCCSSFVCLASLFQWRVWSGLGRWSYRCSSPF